METTSSRIAESPEKGDWVKVWARKLLAGNPFYLVSAALLLFGINRLSVDPQFLNAEVAKLGFNFSALQVYELLVVGVAILLARRRVWYDSILLVVVENLLVLVPFILITQAVLIGRGVAFTLCAGAAVLAVARFGALKRWVRELNLPAGLLAIGAAVLAANLLTPVVYRAIIENGTDEWEKPGLAGWFLVVPALLALGNFLPRRKGMDTAGDARGRGPSRSWMPFLILMLWVTGSCVHLYCVGYVSDLAFHLWMLAPLALVLVWSAWHRLADLLPRPMPASALGRHPLRQALLVAAAFVPFLALAYPSSHLFFALTLVNTALFGLVSGTNHPQNKLALQLGLASGVALFAGIPMDWGSWLTLEFTRARAISFCLGGYLLLQALRSKNPAWGLCGGSVAAVASALLVSGITMNWSLHLGLSFVVLHSLRWEERSFSGELLKGVVGLRIGTAVSWMTHAFVWTRVDGGAPKWMIPSAAVLILLIYVLLGVVTGQWGARVVPAGAALSFLAAPANSFYDLLRVSPSGLTAVLASFVLFGLGTWAAFTKHRWHPPRPMTNDE